MFIFFISPIIGADMLLYYFIIMDILGSLVSGLFGLFGSLFTNSSNSSNVAKTNQMNQAMMREQNSFNRAERLETQDWNWNRTLDMFNMNNEYNSPLAQAARLRAAGINPSNVMGNDNNIAQVQSVPQSSPMSSAPFAGAIAHQNQDPTASMVALASAFSQIQKTNAETEAQRTNNETQSLKNNVEIEKVKADISKTLKDTEVSEEQKHSLRLQYNLLSQQQEMNQFQLRNQEKRWTMEQQQFDKNMRQLDDQHALNQLNYTLSSLDAQIKEFDVSKLPIRFKYELMFKRQELKNMVANEKLTYAQALHEAHKQIETIARTSLLSQEYEKGSYQLSGMALDSSREKDISSIREFLPARVLDGLMYWMTSTLGNVFGGAGAAAIKNMPK